MKISELPFAQTVRARNIIADYLKKVHPSVTGFRILEFEPGQSGKDWSAKIVTKQKGQVEIPSVH